MAQEVQVWPFSLSSNLHHLSNNLITVGPFSLNLIHLLNTAQFSSTAGLLSLATSISFQKKRKRSFAGPLSLNSSIYFDSGFTGDVRYSGPLILSESLTLFNVSRDAWWQKKQPITSKLIYLCEITGDAAGLSDITIPLSNFQYRLYDSGQGAHIEAVIPNAITYEDAIRNRSNGQIKIRRGQIYEDGTRRLSEIARAGNLKITSSTGDRSSSVTVRGNELKEFNTTTLKKKTDNIVSRRMRSDGDYSFQVEPLVGLYPGDYVWLNGSQYQVKEISVAVGAQVHQMNLVVGMA